MKNFARFSLSLLTCAMLLLSACSNPAPATPAPAGSGGDQPAEAPAATLTQAVSGGASSGSQSDPTSAPTLPPAPPEPTATLAHITLPGTPTYLPAQVIQDCALGYTFTAGQPGALVSSCDSWKINLLERPLQTGSLNYTPYLDIEMAQFGADSAWFYGRMRLYAAGMPEDGSALQYFFELDLDFNGRGDILVSVQDLPLGATDWTVAGVRAWQDTNADVGSQTPIRSDAERSGDGYDRLVFDQGYGADPDLVWARRSPDGDKYIELAFKPALLGGDSSFSWWAWALQGDFDPGLFDLVDGSLEAYQLDNTCMLGFNGTLQGFPNQCNTAQPTQAPQVVLNCGSFTTRLSCRAPCVWVGTTQINEGTCNNP